MSLFWVKLRRLGQVVTQVRNVKDTDLQFVGANAITWMELAQCFAGKPETPPAKNTRFTRRLWPLFTSHVYLSRYAKLHENYQFKIFMRVVKPRVMVSWSRIFKFFRAYHAPQPSDICSYKVDFLAQIKMEFCDKILLFWNFCRHKLIQLNKYGRLEWL